MDTCCKPCMYSSVAKSYILLCDYSLEGPSAVLLLQPAVVIEGRSALACLVLRRLERLSQPENVTLSTVTVSSTATGKMNS